MRPVVLRGLLARRLRLVLTSLAIALWVMLITGSYVFTDTFTHSFDKIFTASYKGVDVSITPHVAVGNNDYALMQGVFLIITLAVLGANLLVDLLYGVIDPRTRARS